MAGTRNEGFRFWCPLFVLKGQKLQIIRKQASAKCRTGIYRELVKCLAFLYNRDMKNDVPNGTRTTETVTISRAEYEELKQQAALSNWLREQLESMKKSAFGSKREDASDEVIGQMMLFDEAEAYAYLEELQRRSTPVAAHERATERERVFLLDRLPPNAEVEVELHELGPKRGPVRNAVRKWNQSGKRR